MNREMYIIAGPNGAGKSTFISSYVDVFPNIFICPDNLVDKSIKNTKQAYLLAMKEAASMRQAALAQGLPFYFETVLSTQEKIEFIKYAKSLDYQVALIYLITKNYQINIERIKQRVHKGGHPVPSIKVIDRYNRCLSFMAEAIEICDQAIIFDNSNQTSFIVMEKNDYGYYLHNKDKHHEWVNKFLVHPLEKRGIKFMDEDTTDNYDFTVTRLSRRINRILGR